MDMVMFFNLTILNTPMEEFIYSESETKKE